MTQGRLTQKLYGFMAMLLVLFMLNACLAYADVANARIVEMETDDEQLLLYVKGAGQINSISAMLGQYTSDDVKYGTLAESDIPVKTLILLDNSLSIPQESRKAIKDQLLELIAARKNNEYFAIGTISEQVEIKQAFTNDYMSLKDAIVMLEFQNQETYLTDALYDYLVEDPFAAEKQAFMRILLISDGVDNKSLGYTKDELLTLLEDNLLPIYSIGVKNKNSSNSEELENMFALTRATGAEYCLLNELTNKTQLGQMMGADWQNLAVWVQIPEAAQDGSLQTLTLNMHTAENAEISVALDNVRMPLVAKQLETSEPVEPVPAPVEPVKAQNTGLIIALTVVAVLLVIALAALIGFLLWRKHEKAKFRTVSDAELAAEPENGGTVLLNGGEQNSGGNTVLLWNNGQKSCPKITLTDINAKEHAYQKPIDKSLLIGYDQKMDICVNYDKTVSGKHCEIVRENGEFFIINHSRSNGTLVNGARVSERIPIYSGAIITMGSVEMQLTIED